MSRPWKDQLLTGAAYGLVIGAGVAIWLTLAWFYVIVSMW